MIHKDNPYKTPKIVIDLSGPEGNAFSLIAKADILSSKLGLDSKTVRREMTSGDYETLVNVFDSYFGDFVDLVNMN